MQLEKQEGKGNRHMCKFQGKEVSVMDGWIPVKGGNWPEKGQEVIATMDFSVQVGKPDLRVMMCLFNGNSEQVNRMKAWMPSPESYKEEQ